jgi:hypothetical protein
MGMMADVDKVSSTQQEPHVLPSVASLRHALNTCSSRAATTLAEWVDAAALHSGVDLPVLAPIAPGAAVTTTQGEDDITTGLSQSPSQAGRCLSHLRLAAAPPLAAARPLLVVAAPLLLLPLLLLRPASLPAAAAARRAAARGALHLEHGQKWHCIRAHSMPLLSRQGGGGVDRSGSMLWHV